MYAQMYACLTPQKWKFQNKRHLYYLNNVLSLKNTRFRNRLLTANWECKAIFVSFKVRIAICGLVQWKFNDRALPVTKMCSSIFRRSRNFKHKAKTLIRLWIREGWCKFSLGAHVRRHIFTCCGSNMWMHLAYCINPCPAESGYTLSLQTV